MEQGKLHIYCGDGKGKTTAAVGLCARARGQGLRVVFTQFLKDSASGELRSLERLGVCVPGGAPVHGFLWNMTQEEKEQVAKEHRARLDDVFEAAQNADLLVLDEILPVISMGLVEEQTLLQFLTGRPSGLEVVLTGREPTPGLLALADYVSEIKAVKHPFDRGVQARKGIEF